MFDNIRADIARKQRYYVRPERRNWFRVYFKTPLQLGSIAVIVYRFGRWAYRLKIPVLRELLLTIAGVLRLLVMVTAGISIQVRADIGPGFVIHNFSGIFIPETTIGKNCTLNQGVTIGNIRGAAKRPVIGDNVYIGVGAVVVGDISIGNNVVIGSNSLVMASVADNCTVVGVPARVVSRQPTSEYLEFVDY